MKALLITQCPDQMMWYAGLVGQTVPYIPGWSSCYKSRQPNGVVNMVKFEDATIVDKGEPR